ncbi:hypothetical protein VitviT2T_008198 [Vitis vinifera]|uniref:C3H1-type domain-containing protein n=1 Tax=Vitis vinifera TaxID=29760 RepID=A0ABY9C1Q5_VITVI|nr:hypothetical protein VitviT2T_008198 [Vitis vinifera]
MGLSSCLSAPQCTHYAQRGMCKFGLTCKFDHLETQSYCPFVPSLADMPVALCPVESSMGTLTPSSSSSDLRLEFISGSSKEFPSTRMSSLTSKPSGSVGSFLKKIMGLIILVSNSLV